MQFIRKTRNGITAVYAIYALATIIGVFLSLNAIWHERINSEGQDLLRNNRIISSAFEHTIIDGTRLLDLSKSQVCELVLNHTLSDERIHDVLVKATTTFQTFNAADEYGLLMFINVNGSLVATSSDKTFEKIDFTDRYYYQAAKAHPDKKIIVGPLLKARTTGWSVFHIASPVLDSQGEFLGELVLQVKIDDLSKFLDDALDVDGQRNDIILNNNEIVFTYPSSDAHANSLRGVPFNKPKTLSLNELNDKWVMNYSHDTIEAQSMLQSVGAVSYSRVAIDNLLSAFLKKSLGIILYALLSLLALGFAAYRLFVALKAKHLEVIYSRTDPLTQLPNRRGFDEFFMKGVNISRRNKQSICALMVDIDHFKIVNDSYGHAKGDIVLATVAELLKQSAGRPNDFCCRWGGEEFVILLPETTLKGAETIATKILEKVRKTPIEIELNQKIHITVSVGISISNELDNVDSLDLIDMADQAMYQAKESGRDRYEVFAA